MGSGQLGRIYFSNAAEGTAGVANTLARSFMPTNYGFKRVNRDSLDVNISGVETGRNHTREGYSAAGDFTAIMSADPMSWMTKFLYGTSATSALVAGGTSTVYEHEWSTWAARPKTFTQLKMPDYTTPSSEKWAGNSISRLQVKSNDGRIMVTSSLIGMCAQYQKGVAAPSPDVDLVIEDNMIGQMSQILIDGVALAAGAAMPDWSVDLNAAIGLVPGIGSTDGSGTRIDRSGRKGFTAQVTQYDDLDDVLADLADGTYRRWEFVCWGDTIDAAFSLRQKVHLIFPSARLVQDVNTDMQDPGVYKIPYTVEARYDSVDEEDAVVRIRDLNATHTI